MTQMSQGTQMISVLNNFINFDLIDIFYVPKLFLG